MTKEELKLDAESKLDEWSDPNMGCFEGYCYSEVADFMFRFSEPREERIETLEKENAELKVQIEKMRNFQNCDYQSHIIDCPIFKSGRHISCKKCPHWILQEVDKV